MSKKINLDVHESCANCDTVGDLEFEGPAYYDVDRVVYKYFCYTCEKHGQMVYKMTLIKNEKVK